VKGNLILSTTKFIWKNLGKSRKFRLVRRCTEIVAVHISKQNRIDKYLTASFGFAILLFFGENFIVLNFVFKLLNNPSRFVRAAIIVFILKNSVASI
jgi:hypothetical protein